jgi:hypothetical protein
MSIDISHRPLYPTASARNPVQSAQATLSVALCSAERREADEHAVREQWHLRDFLIQLHRGAICYPNPLFTIHSRLGTLEQCRAHSRRVSSGALRHRFWSTLTLMQSGMLFLLVLVSLLYCFRKRRGCFDQHRARFKGTDTAIDIPHTSFLDPPDCKEKPGLRPVSALVPLPRASYR